MLPTASYHTVLLYLPQVQSCLARRVSSFPCWRDCLVKLRFQDQDFSWKFLLADVAFPFLGVDFLRFHKLLIDPEGHALLDSTGWRFAGQARPSPRMATVVVGFAQPYLIPGQQCQTKHHWSSVLSTPHLRTSQHWTSQLWTSQWRTSSTYLHSTPLDRPTSWEPDRLGWPTAACWRSFRLWSAHQSGYWRSAMTWYTTSSHMSHPSLPSFGSWTVRSWRPLMRNSSSWRRTTLYSVPLQKGLGPLEISLEIPQNGQHFTNQQYNNIYNLQVEKHLYSTCHIKINLVLYTKKPFSIHFLLKNCMAVLHSMCKFLSNPRRIHNGKKDREEKEEYGLLCAVICCAQPPPPPHLSPTLRTI